MTNLVEMKTADLTGEALNCSVAKALGLHVYLAEPHYMNAHRVMVRYTPEGCHFEQEKRFQPSTDWAQGGELIDKYEIVFAFFPDDAERYWASCCSMSGEEYGPTHLIAACRAIVASVLGDTVSVPKELCHE
ncbi:phage protein NinX family protein [Pseudomonas folii]|uniref:DUF2591 domain-containing protein n=1 Tax=Pseudomonas folii TaxID=2762593 RepID=A0ABR7ATT4_9PSED|nr:phage protein NinX family protein [Pseudomonas folii]MBC3948331.1 DUF2591 domain-containing protein [Pseudomonas folii]